MFGTAWLSLRQAREALRNGRLEEANRILTQTSARGHKSSFELQQQILRGFLSRAERHLRNDDSERAWADLLQAEALDPADPQVVKLRQALARLGLAEARAALEAGNPTRAAEAAARLRDRRAYVPELSAVADAAREWQKAGDAADRGEFGLAIQIIDKIRLHLSPPTPGLDRTRGELLARQQSFTRLIVDLHAALDARHWREVVSLADQVLVVAPHHADARRVRSEAWRAIEPETLPINAGPPSDHTPVEPLAASRRLLLWIDGVGGFLICLGNRVTLGQAAGEGPIDVPLLADVSRMHATLTRDPEGYLIEAARPLQVNSKPTHRATLQTGDRVTLGMSCQFVFRIPVPVSSSARLELVSGHRLSYGVDSVLLMSDSLVMGRGQQAHVPMPDIRHDLVLYKQKEGLALRCPGPFTIDGRPCRDRGVLGLQAAVSGPDFAFALEPVGRP